MNRFYEPVLSFSFVRSSLTYTQTHKQTHSTHTQRNIYTKHIYVHTFGRQLAHENMTQMNVI